MNTAIALVILLAQMAAYYFIWSFIKKQAAAIRDGEYDGGTITRLVLAALAGVFVVFSVFYLVYWYVAKDMGIL
ncbi:hypothetical protein [Marinicella sp. W31]|uniref:hypothetical protein n=1 Tax=Marinicella sp. W31 TaxID=3023713 RepID=UPI00375735B5